MRQILFKAKRKDNGEWVEGYYRKANYPVHVEHLIHPFEHLDCCGEENFVIDESTLSQFTGLYDKNGEKIWEGNVVRYKTKSWSDCGKYLTDIFCVQYKNGAFITGFHQGSSTRKRPKLIITNCVEVIGNRFDNPELLKQ